MSVNVTVPDYQYHQEGPAALIIYLIILVFFGILTPILIKTKHRSSDEPWTTASMSHSRPTPL